ncbi:CoA pyrophosphatase [Paraneptunicella aestuarii]|uniref:CoA pyrophosphatase n=1 Tax=Paraneptunicella aestuarii TaxID=2831148 RepID=UPI001E36FE03|nr:CoA pyrophosphatase [Paraneptunicella aestuarii]UAA40210.1 CoA pyrophosphatase [Paraneptunicella aestuarii]
MNEAQFLQRFHHLRRIEDEQDFPLRRAGKKAAVLCPVVCRDELTVLFTKRASHLKHHAGQICFPGGRHEDYDSCLKETALRETEEEIGLSRQYTKIIGNLQSFRTVSGYEVTPYVGLIEPYFDLELDRNEVEQVFEVPLSYLVDKRNHIAEPVHRNGVDYSIYFIPWEDTYIWGATAAFVRILSNHLTENL